MDNYQAVYDATRSRMSFFDGQSLSQEIARRFDISFYVDSVKQGFLEVTYEMQRPSTIYKPKITIDGNQWCALYGDDLQSGVAGFGDSPAKAMEDFDKNWYEPLIK